MPVPVLRWARFPFAIRSGQEIYIIEINLIKFLGPSTPGSDFVCHEIVVELSRGQKGEKRSTQGLEHILNDLRREFGLGGSAIQYVRIEWSMIDQNVLNTPKETSPTTFFGA